MKLVVVDDNHVNLEIFELTLELIEASAELFDNGRDALDYLGRCPGIPDVMGDGSHRDFRIRLPVARATMLPRMAFNAAGGRTAMAHDSPRQV